MDTSQPKPPRTIVILSGGTGRTAEQVVRAALAQFDSVEVRLVRKPKIRSAAAARAAIRQAKRDGAAICHSFVEPKIREAVIHEADKQLLPTVDVLGPTLSLLVDYLQVPARGRPGLSYELNRERFDRLDAVDFTVAHDDGLRVADLGRADVVLVGVSRVSKSVTCYYLASHGVRAANVPLLVDQPLPDELLRLDPQRVIGLTMNAERLRQIRQTRSGHIGPAQLDRYLSADDIQLELRTAMSQMAQQHWRCIDISYKSVEEVALEIMGLLPEPPA